MTMSTTLFFLIITLKDLLRWVYYEAEFKINIPYGQYRKGDLYKNYTA